MRRLSKFKIFIYFGCLFCIANLAYSEEWPPEVDIYAIRFDFESGYSDDALDIRKNNDTDIPLNEWLPSSSRNNPFAYIRNQSSRHIEVIFYVEDLDYRYIAVHTTTSGTGIGDVNVSFSVPWYEDEYWLKEVTLGGEESVPSSVGKREFTWSWYLDEIGEIELEEPLYFASSGGQYGHKYYTLYASPESPMSEPWSDVLDYSAEWAEGSSTADGICEDILQGFEDYYEWEGNCDYLSSDFVRLVTSLGIGASQHRWENHESYPAGDVWDLMRMKTYPITTVGNTEAVHVWGFHQWVEAASKQRDPSTGSSYPSTFWGDYEDYLFDEYETVNNSYEKVWVDNQSGQDKGCEKPEHRRYDSNPELKPWTGPG